MRPAAIGAYAPTQAGDEADLAGRFSDAVQGTQHAAASSVHAGAGGSSTAQWRASLDALLRGGNQDPEILEAVMVRGNPAYLAMSGGGTPARGPVDVEAMFDTQYVGQAPSGVDLREFWRFVGELAGKSPAFQSLLNNAHLDNGKIKLLVIHTPNVPGFDERHGTFSRYDYVTKSIFLNMKELDTTSKLKSGLLKYLSFNVNEPLLSSIEDAASGGVFETSDDPAAAYARTSGTVQFSASKILGKIVDDGMRRGVRMPHDSFAYLREARTFSSYAEHIRAQDASGVTGGLKEVYNFQKANGCVGAAPPRLSADVPVSSPGPDHGPSDAADESLYNSAFIISDTSPDALMALHEEHLNALQSIRRGEDQAPADLSTKLVLSFDEDVSPALRGSEVGDFIQTLSDASPAFRAMINNATLNGDGKIAIRLVRKSKDWRTHYNTQTKEIRVNTSFSDTISRVEGSIIHGLALSNSDRTMTFMRRAERNGVFKQAADPAKALDNVYGRVDMTNAIMSRLVDIDARRAGIRLPANIRASAKMIVGYLRNHPELSDQFGDYSILSGEYGKASSAPSGFSIASSAATDANPGSRTLS